MRLARARVLAAIAAACWSPPPAEAAQIGLFTDKIRIVPRQSIDWGLVIPGAASRVNPTDVQRRGQVDFVGKGKQETSVLLPQALVSRAGERLPLRFVRGDLVVTYTHRGETQIPDPSLPIEINTRGNQGDAMLFIGGTALPAANQRTGAYVAIITVVFQNKTL